MGWTAQSTISHKNFSKMVISSNNETCQITCLMWKLQFNDCSCHADQINAINVFISITYDIIQIYNSNMIAFDSCNIHFFYMGCPNSAVNERINAAKFQVNVKTAV